MYQPYLFGGPPRGSGKALENDGQGGIRTHGTLAGTPVFETGRFNRSRTCPTPRRVDGETGRRVDRDRALPCPTRLPVCPSTRLVVTDRVGFEPTKRLPVYTLSRRVPSATRPPIPTTRRTDAQAHRRTDARSEERRVGKECRSRW